MKLLEEHDQIIENIEKRNKEEAAKIVCRHIENQVESVLHYCLKKELGIMNKKTAHRYILYIKKGGT